MGDRFDFEDPEFREFIASSLNRGAKVVDIARWLGLSSPADYHWFRRQLAARGIDRRNVTYHISDEELVAFARKQQSSQPAKGWYTLYTTLQSQDIFITQSKARWAMRQVDPTGHNRWQRLTTVLLRRVYWAPYPNYVWHADKNDKLVRYGICSFGSVDGRSRKVIYLHATNSARGSVHVALYERAVSLFGRPDLLRIDAGSENIAVRRLHHSLGGHWIVGRSVSNVPIHPSSLYPLL